MKKIITIIVIGLILLIPSTALAKDKINIYFFRGDECPHCEEALNFLYQNIDKIPDNMEIITYETWSNKKNAKLQDRLSEILEVPEDSRGDVPFVVVGNDYRIGVSASLAGLNTLVEMANKYVDNDEYEDLVAKTINDMQKENKKLKFKSYTLEKLLGPNKIGNIIVLSVFGVIVIGFAGMIILSRKK